MRMAIISHTRGADELLGGEVEMDESYFEDQRKGKRGKVTTNKVPVFDILEFSSVFKVEVIMDVTAETLLNMTINTIWRGSIKYTHPSGRVVM